MAILPAKRPAPREFPHKTVLREAENSVASDETQSRLSLPFPRTGRTAHVEAAEVQTDDCRPIAWNSFRQNAQTGIPLFTMDCVGISMGIALATVTASLLGQQIFGQQITQVQLQQPQILLNGLVFVVVYALLGLYPGVGINPIVELKHMILGTLGGGGILLATSLAFCSPEIMTLLFIPAVTAFCVLIVPVVRCLSRSVFSKFGWWTQPAIIVGSCRHAHQLLASLQRKSSSGLKPIGIVLAGNPASVSASNVGSASVEYLGPLSDLSKIARQNGVNWALIPTTDENSSKINDILVHCGAIPNLIVVPQFDAFPSLWTRTRDVGGFLGIHVRERLLSPTSQFCKRTFDLAAVIIGGILMLPFLLPLFVGTWAWIRLSSPGPIFYSQERIGKGGRKFRAWKFRSMVPNGDEVLENYLKANPELRETWDKTQKLKHDPRVIPGIGTFLRKSSFDELPQLWNVLIGDMSLVGPRPFIEYQGRMYGEAFRLYQKVRPGITGLWQISGRNHTSFDDRVKYDAYYVRNWSLWMDIFILGRTIRTVLGREGAY